MKTDSKGFEKAETGTNRKIKKTGNLNVILITVLIRFIIVLCDMFRDL
jgi:hypothetical protein